MTVRAIIPPSGVSRLRVRVRLDRRPTSDEMIDRRVHLFAVQHPRRTLRLDRTREGHTKVPANELTADTQNRSDFLRTRMLTRTKGNDRIRLFRSVRCIRHSIHLTFVVARSRANASGPDSVMVVPALTGYTPERLILRSLSGRSVAVIVHVRIGRPAHLAFVHGLSLQMINVHDHSRSRSLGWSIVCLTTQRSISEIPSIERTFVRTRVRPPRRAPRVESRFSSRRARAQRVRRISRAQIEAACAAGG